MELSLYTKSKSWFKIDITMKNNKLIVQVQF